MLNAIILVLAMSASIICSQEPNLSIASIANIENKSQLFSVTTNRAPIVIMVGTESCPKCKRLKPEFMDLTKHIEFAHMRFYAVDGESAIDVVRELEVVGFPALCFWLNGKKRIRYMHSITADEVKEVFAKLEQDQLSVDAKALESFYEWLSVNIEN